MYDELLWVQPDCDATVDSNNLAFYAQSTSAVLSGRSRRRASDQIVQVSNLLRSYLSDSDLTQAVWQPTKVAYSRNAEPSKLTLYFEWFKIPDGIFWTAEPLVTELGTVMHHHEPQSPSV